MTTATESSGDSIDRHARQLHQAALANVSPATLARLRQARHAATSAPPRRRPLLASWLAGGAVAATLAVAVMLRPGAPAPDAPASYADGGEVPADFLAPATDPAVALENDPGFYLWLDSVDATALAME
ncbi:MULTISPECIES: hypothetical protein [Pseudoxanthomonas]|uniref:hypothetical protein n=1 Tax=Pseudoxanthomonas TaxID=83618 RepID=UPI0004B3AEF5|nr:MULTISPECIES: hypothetical protein [Pseudoxanthomonas]